MNMTDYGVMYLTSKLLYFIQMHQMQINFSPEIDSRNLIYDEVLSLINEGESALNGEMEGLLLD